MAYGAAAGACGFTRRASGARRTLRKIVPRRKLRVREGRAHAALVFDGTACVGWCQFGPTEELPRIKSRRAYREGLTALPDWRITCFFVDKRPIAAGASRSAALEGALREIARRGGGTVESYPEDTAGRTVSIVLPPQRNRLDVRATGLRALPTHRQERWVVTKVVR